MTRIGRLVLKNTWRLYVVLAVYAWKQVKNIFLKSDLVGKFNRILNPGKIRDFRENQFSREIQSNFKFRVNSFFGAKNKKNFSLGKISQIFCLRR